MKIFPNVSVNPFQGCHPVRPADEFISGMHEYDDLSGIPSINYMFHVARSPLFHKNKSVTPRRMFSFFTFFLCFFFRSASLFLFVSSLPPCFKQNTLLTEESGGRKAPAGFFHFLLHSDGFLSLSRLLSQVSCRQSTAGRATPSYSSPIRRTRQELRYSTVYSPTAGF